MAGFCKDRTLSGMQPWYITQPNLHSFLKYCISTQNKSCLCKFHEDIWWCGGITPCSLNFGTEIAVSNQLHALAA